MNWFTCTAVRKTIRNSLQGCQQVYQRDGMKLLHMHKVFPAGRGKQMVM